MIANPKLEFLAPEQYLEQEQNRAVKHEYIGGLIYAMAGASDSHVTIALNTATLLKTHLRGSSCRVFISDMKIRIEDLNIFYYPDVVVTCDERDKSNATYKLYPRIIIEVLSPSTEAFDRGDKFVDYQRIKTLEDYVLISTTRQRVDHFHRNDQDLWSLQSYTSDQKVVIESLGFETSLASLYEDVSLTTAASAIPPLV
jgi:Uma2 family endonuclease